MSEMDRIIIAKVLGKDLPWLDSDLLELADKIIKAHIPAQEVCTCGQEWTNHDDRKCKGKPLPKSKEQPPAEKKIIKPLNNYEWSVQDIFDKVQELILAHNGGGK